MHFRRKCAALLLLYHIGAALEIFVPPTYQVKEGSSALIPCKYSVGSHPVDPTFFAAFWYLQGKQILSYDDQVRAIDPRYSLDTEKVFNGIVDLSISKITISDGGVYTCSVLYSPIQKKEDITVDVEALTAPPQLVITNNAVGMNEESVLRCSITGFYPEDITITWFRGTEILGRVSKDGPRSNSDGTFSVDSSVIITPTEEDRERNFSCRVQHKSLKQPLQTDFKLKYKDTQSANPTLSIIHIAGIVAAGVILVIIIIAVVVYLRRRRRPSVPQKNENTLQPLNHPAVPNARDSLPETGHTSGPGIEGPLPDLMMEEIEVPPLALNNIATLTCKISNYINGEHTVKWYEEKENERTAVSDSRKITTTERDPESDNTHISYLSLIPVTKRDHGIKYICRVEGSNPEMTKEKCTGNLQVTETINSPEKKKIPENQIKASDQGRTPKKVTLEERKAEEPRLELSVNEFTNSKGKLELPEQIPEPLAEQEVDLQGEYDDHENPQELESKHRKGRHPANELSGEEGTEEHSLSTEKEIDTREEEEEENPEKEGNEEPSGPINTPFTEEEEEEEEEEEDSLKVRRENSSGLCSAEESPDDHDNEETSLLSNKMKLDIGLKESSTIGIGKDSGVFLSDDGDNDDDDENKPLNNV